jgi:hypothetical protein
MLIASTRKRIGVLCVHRNSLQTTGQAKLEYRTPMLLRSAYDAFTDKETEQRQCLS